MDEDALMRRAAAGDVEAFGTLVKAHQRRLVRVAHGMLGDAEAAQDAAQEAFLRLWRVRARYDPRGDFTPFLLRIVRNVCLDYARAARPREALRESCGAAEAAAPDPEEALQRRALARAVREAVAGLPEPQRMVFVLNQYEGLSYAEIAAALGCPVGTVASRKHLAVEALRRRLGSWMEGERSK